MTRSAQSTLWFDDFSYADSGTKPSDRMMRDFFCVNYDC